MLFNSMNFLLFFAAVSLICFLLPAKLRPGWLLLASWLYYASFNPAYLIILLILILLTWFSALWMQKVSDTGRRRVLIVISCLFEGSFLLFYKYMDFLLECFDRLLRFASFRPIETRFELLLPLGISYFTFKALSYSLDVYHGRMLPEKNFIKVALYLSFFPSLLAGPIDRAKETLPQMDKVPGFDFDRVKHGLSLMLWGLFLKMVIADRLSIFVDRVYADPALYRHAGVVGITSALLYGVQVYCDFSGYSIIAVGCAQVLGFMLPSNFERPFFSKSWGEFWRRWHVTLMQWLRDYVYFPLGGSRVGQVRHCLNLMLVFLISGIWHGAGWNFIVWGFLLGAFRLLEMAIMPLINKIPDSWLRRDSFGWKASQAMLTGATFSFCMIFLRADSLKQALNIIKGFFVFNPELLFDQRMLSFGLSGVDFVIVFAGLLLLFLVSWQQRGGNSLREWVDRQPFWVRWGLILGLIFSILAFGIYGPDYAASQFVYFQF